MRFLNTHTDICGRLQSLTLANNWRDPFDHNVNMDSDDHPLNFELFDPMLEAVATFVRRSSLTTMCLSGFLIDRRILDALLCQHRMVEVGFNSCQLSHCAEQYVIDTFELRIPLESRIKYIDICMTRAQEQQTLWLMVCLLPQLTHLSVHATSPDRGFLLATDEGMPLLADTLRRLERLDLDCIAALEFARLVEWFIGATRHGGPLALTHLKLAFTCSIPDNLMDVLLQAVHAGSPPLAVLALDGAQLGEPLHLFDLVATLFPDLDGLAIMRRARLQRRSDSSHWPLPVYEYAARLAAFRRLRYFGANFRYEIFDDPPDLRMLFDGPLSEKQRAAEHIAWECEYGADPLPLAHQALARPFAAHCPSLEYMAVPLSAYYCQIERTGAGTVNCTSALFTGARSQAAYRIMEGYNPIGPSQSWGKRPRECV